MLIFFILIAKPIESAMHLYDGKMPLCNAEQEYEGDVIFHCYWQGMLNEKHLISIKSCYYFNVLNKQNRKIVLWIKDYFPSRVYREISKYAEIKIFNLEEEIKGTFLQQANLYNSFNPVAYSNFVRMVLLYKYGGCWFDLDVFFLKDFSPLFNAFKDEICLYRWERRNYPNSAIIISLAPYDERLQQNMLLIMGLNRGWSFQSAQLTYDLPLQFTVLPCEWFDAAWLEENTDRLFDSFFEFSEQKIFLDNFYPSSFCYHWHNRWNKKIEPGSPIFRLSNELNILLQAR